MFKSVIETVLLFVFLTLLSYPFCVQSAPAPEPQILQGFGQLAGTALGAAAGSFLQSGGLGPSPYGGGFGGRYPGGGFGGYPGNYYGGGPSYYGGGPGYYGGRPGGYYGGCRRCGGRRYYRG